MSIDYVMPRLAMAMNEGTINEWLVTDGDRVEQGQPLLVVETEKVVYDVEAPASGFIRILVPAGETVPVESRIAVITENDSDSLAKEVSEVSGERTAPTTKVTQMTVAEAYTPSSRIISSPAARRLAKKNDLDLAQIEASGPRGRIVKRDIVAAIDGKEPSKRVEGPAKRSDGTATELARLPVAGSPRAAVSRRMMESLQSSAQLSSFWESDITELQKTQKMFAGKEEQLGTRISMNSLIIKAIALAIADVPIANAAIVDNEIVIYRNVNVGIAIALPGKTQWDSTLMVPVVRNVQTMRIAQIDKAMKELVTRAREGGLTADDMTGSTITLSSTAGIAPPGLRTTPILNLPNAVIVGPSTPQEKFVVVDGEASVRTMMPISVTFDHRVLDGEPAARFMSALHQYLENPVLILA